MRWLIYEFSKPKTSKKFKAIRNYNILMRTRTCTLQKRLQSESFLEFYNNRLHVREHTPLIHTHSSSSPPIIQWPTQNSGLPTCQRAPPLINHTVNLYLQITRISDRNKSTMEPMEEYKDNWYS